MKIISQELCQRDLDSRLRGNDKQIPAYTRMTNRSSPEFTPYLIRAGMTTGI